MANRMNNKQAQEWNKAQADALRKLADLVENGDYESLNFNTVIDYFHFLGSPNAKPERMSVHFELKYIEGEATYATPFGTFGKPKEETNG